MNQKPLSVEDLKRLEKDLQNLFIFDEKRSEQLAIVEDALRYYSKFSNYSGWDPKDIDIEITWEHALISLLRTLIELEDKYGSIRFPEMKELPSSSVET